MNTKQSPTKSARRALAVALPTALTLLLASTPASAEEFTRRSYILPHGNFELTGPPARPRMVDINLSRNSALQPVMIAPHLYWGVSDVVTLGITHERGLCLNDGCGAP
ncbi:MAG TPA: hypothetical protein VGP93_03800, partial [Polyangiaceae bacterium]|nr:hypothetical protein [Polyangiaceae bacterium]